MEAKIIKPPPLTRAAHILVEARHRLGLHESEAAGLHAEIIQFVTP